MRQKKIIKLLLFLDSVIICFLNNLRDLINILLDLRREFSEMVGFKMII